MDVLREELEGDCVIRRTGDFWTCCCCWLSLVSIGIEGVVERTGSAGDLIGRSIGDGLLCGCWTKELEDIFLLKPFVLTSLFKIKRINYKEIVLLISCLVFFKFQIVLIKTTKSLIICGNFLK